MNNIRYILLDKLDKQLYHSLKGNFGESERLMKELLIEFPYNSRILYNSAFMYLRNGDIKTGMKMLNKGRDIGIFGSPPLPYPILPNANIKNKVILINLEGGFGDNFLGLKFVKELSKNNRVIVLAQKSIHNFLQNQEYIYKYYQYAIEVQDYVDYWAPSLGIEKIFNYDNYNQIPNEPHLFYPITKESKENKIKIGIKFRGGNNFDHDKYRSPKISDIVSTITKIKNADLYSLEKEYIKLPDRIINRKINTWCDCANLIQEMDLIISTCTSVAHLSAGMGKKTYIIIPILPYWIWAYPKNNNYSWYYSNVKLFKQEHFGKWEETLNSLYQQLISLV